MNFDKLYRSEYRKIVSVLTKTLGIHNLEIAEEIANDCFVSAMEKWKGENIPQNPEAWLYTVAKNKAKDYFKRNKIFEEKVLQKVKDHSKTFELMELEFTEKLIADSELEMIFVICNPSINLESQTALALNILFGFKMEEIASAFLTNKDAVQKRVSRGKEKLKELDLVLKEEEIPVRLESVCRVLYLLFNEGYYSSQENQLIRKELCLSAMKLCYVLLENSRTNFPIANALLSLFCFHASRLESRTDEEGNFILYEEQDANSWNEDLITKGNFFLIQSAKGQKLSKYHLEASIAYWHSTKLESSEKWENILQLYNKLLQMEYSPYSALSRAFAVSKVHGVETGIQETLKLNLVENHFYFALLGHLYSQTNPQKAFENYTLAFSKAKSKKEKLFYENKLKGLKT